MSGGAPTYRDILHQLFGSDHGVDFSIIRNLVNTHDVANLIEVVSIILDRSYNAPQKNGEEGHELNPADSTTLARGTRFSEMAVIDALGINQGQIYANENYLLPCAAFKPYGTGIDPLFIDFVRILRSRTTWKSGAEFKEAIYSSEYRRYACQLTDTLSHFTAQQLYPLLVAKASELAFGIRESSTETVDNVSNSLEDVPQDSPQDVAQDLPQQQPAQQPSDLRVKHHDDLTQWLSPIQADMETVQFRMEIPIKSEFYQLLARHLGALVLTGCQACNVGLVHGLATLDMNGDNPQINPILLDDAKKPLKTPSIPPSFFIESMNRFNIYHVFGKFYGYSRYYEKERARVASILTGDLEELQQEEKRLQSLQSFIDLHASFVDFLFSQQQHWLDLVAPEIMSFLFVVAHVYDDKRVLSLLSQQYGITTSNFLEYTIEHHLDHVVNPIVKSIYRTLVVDNDRCRNAMITSVMKCLAVCGLQEAITFMLKTCNVTAITDLAQGLQDENLITSSFFSPFVEDLFNVDMVKFLILKKAKLCTNSSNGALNNIFMTFPLPPTMSIHVLNDIMDYLDQFIQRNKAYKPSVKPHEFVSLLRKSWSIVSSLNYVPRDYFANITVQQDNGELKHPVISVGTYDVDLTPSGKPKGSAPIRAILGDGMRIPLLKRIFDAYVDLKLWKQMIQYSPDHILSTFTECFPLRMYNDFSYANHYQSIGLNAEFLSLVQFFIPSKMVPTMIKLESFPPLLILMFACKSISSLHYFLQNGFTPSPSTFHLLNLVYPYTMSSFDVIPQDSIKQFLSTHTPSSSDLITALDGGFSPSKYPVKCTLPSILMASTKQHQNTLDLWYSNIDSGQLKALKDLTPYNLNASKQYGVPLLSFDPLMQHDLCEDSQIVENYKNYMTDPNGGKPMVDTYSPDYLHMIMTINAARPAHQRSYFLTMYNLLYTNSPGDDYIDWMRSDDILVQAPFLTNNHVMFNIYKHSFPHAPSSLFSQGKAFSFFPAVPHFLSLYFQQNMITDVIHEVLHDYNHPRPIVRATHKTVIPHQPPISPVPQSPHVALPSLSPPALVTPEDENIPVIHNQHTQLILLSIAFDLLSAYQYRFDPPSDEKRSIVTNFHAQLNSVRIFTTIFRYTRWVPHVFLTSLLQETTSVTAESIYVDILDQFTAYGGILYTKAHKLCVQPVFFHKVVDAQYHEYMLRLFQAYQIDFSSILTPIGSNYIEYAISTTQFEGFNHSTRQRFLKRSVEYFILSAYKHNPPLSSSSTSSTQNYISSTDHPDSQPAIPSIFDPNAQGENLMMAALGLGQLPTSLRLASYAKASPLRPLLQRDCLGRTCLHHLTSLSRLEEVFLFSNVYKKHFKRYHYDKHILMRVGMYPAYFSALFWDYFKTTQMTPQQLRMHHAQQQARGQAPQEAEQMAGVLNAMPILKLESKVMDDDLQGVDADGKIAHELTMTEAWCIEMRNYFHSMSPSELKQAARLLTLQRTKVEAQAVTDLLLTDTVIGPDSELQDHASSRLAQHEGDDDGEFHLDASRQYQVKGGSPSVVHSSITPKTILAAGLSLATAAAGLLWIGGWFSSPSSPTSRDNQEEE